MTINDDSVVGHVLKPLVVLCKTTATCTAVCKCKPLNQTYVELANQVYSSGTTSSKAGDRIASVDIRCSFVPFGCSWAPGYTQKVIGVTILIRLSPLSRPLEPVRPVRP